MNVKMLYDIAMLIVECMESRQRFEWAVRLRWLNMRDACIRSMPSMSPDAASARGSLALLDWWKCNGMPSNGSWSVKSMDQASAAGHLHVLDWWKESKIGFKHSERSVDWASGAGRIDVLEWWRQNSRVLLHSHAAVDLASAAGRLDVLDWLLQQARCENTCLLYSCHAYELARMNGHRDVLLWLDECLHKYGSRRVSLA